MTIMLLWSATPKEAFTVIMAGTAIGTNSATGLSLKLYFNGMPAVLSGSAGHRLSV
jgi:hypothetical protein